MQDWRINLFGCLQAKVKKITCTPIDINWRVRITITYLTLWSPSPSAARSLLTFCVVHARAQLVPIYSCMYYNVHMLNSGGWVAWKLSQNNILYGAAILGLLLHYSNKKLAQSAVHSHIVVCSLCCMCVLLQE
jgi:hypothetical protein